MGIIVMFDKLLAGENLGRGLLHGHALGALDQVAVEAPDVPLQLNLIGKSGVTTLGVAEEQPV